MCSKLHFSGIDFTIISKSFYASSPLPLKYKERCLKSSDPDFYPERMEFDIRFSLFNIKIYMSNELGNKMNMN